MTDIRFGEAQFGGFSACLQSFTLVKWMSTFFISVSSSLVVDQSQKPKLAFNFEHENIRFICVSS